jgi:DNA polymerase-3 subunit epsilon
LRKLVSRWSVNAKRKNMKLVVIDTETTGAVYQGNDPHDVVQLAGIIVIDGKPVEAFSFKCAPHFPENYEDEALFHTKTTMEELRLRPEPKGVYAEFISLLHKYRNRYDKTDRFFFVAYNAKFDFDMMNVWANRCGDKYFLGNFWSPPICVMQIAAYQLMEVRAQLPNFKLETVCKFVGVPFNSDEAHDALYDIQKTYKLYKMLTQ